MIEKNIIDEDFKKETYTPVIEEAGAPTQKVGFKKRDKKV